MSTLVGNPPFRYRVEESWAKFPNGGPEGEAVGVACDSKARVYVFLRGPKPVQVFERDGTPVMSWGEDCFQRPHGIFIGPDDVVYCTDDFGHAVHAFTTKGERLFTLGTGEASDTGATSIDYRTIQRVAGPFNYPCNLAIGPNGQLYVADGYGNARVHRFSKDGTLLGSWGEPGAGPGQFHVVHGIAVDSEGMVYVADRENSRIQIFSEEGKYAGVWTDVARPCQIFIDKVGLCYVAELGFRAGRWPGTGTHQAGQTGGRVSIFDRTGKLLARWGGGENPCAAGDFFAPHDIWVDSHGDVYVSEVTLSAGGRRACGVIDVDAGAVEFAGPHRLLAGQGAVRGVQGTARRT
jgi:DNA-binding beta-propeller fold protein YncE